MAARRLVPKSGSDALDAKLDEGWITRHDDARSSIPVWRTLEVEAGIHPEFVGYTSDTPMPTYSDVLHNFVVPAALGLVLTSLKVMAGRREPSFDELNGIALDLILVAIGASAIYLNGKPANAIISFGVGAAVLATTLLLIQYHRSGKAAKIAPARLPETSWWFAIFQLTLGMAAFIWLFEAS